MHKIMKKARKTRRRLVKVDDYDYVLRKLLLYCVFTENCIVSVL